MRIFACLLLLFLFAPNAALAAKVRIVVTTPAGLQQAVYLARPLGLDADRPVLFALHGEDRDASKLCDSLYPLAEEHKVLIVLPEFSERLFPGAGGYAEGNVRSARGKNLPPSEWSFSAIEAIFDAVRARFAMTAGSYSMYGRAEGGQFVQRYLYFLPEARVRRAVAADPDWYTMPDFMEDYPRGLAGTAAGELQLRRALTLPFTVFLAESDANASPGQPTGALDPDDLEQPAARLTRGRAFFARAREAAEELQVPLAWQLETVPDAGSGDRQTAKAALESLLP